MDDSRNSMFCSQADRVVEGEKAITGQHRTPAALTGGLEGDLRRTNPVHLAGSYSEALTFPNDNDRIGTNVAH